MVYFDVWDRGRIDCLVCIVVFDGLRFYLMVVVIRDNEVEFVKGLGYVLIEEFDGGM